jgi:hypothetical protein
MINLVLVFFLVILGVDYIFLKDWKFGLIAHLQKATHSILDHISSS